MTISPAPTEGPLTADELQLAARNKGMPLRGSATTSRRQACTTCSSISTSRISTRRLGGFGSAASCAARSPLSLDDIRARPRRSLPVTLECAGNGRARLFPRPISQPWLNEAVGTAEWTGTPLTELLAEAGVAPEAVEILFSGTDHGVEKGYEHDYARSLTIVEAVAPDVLLAYEMNGRPLEPQHGFPLRLLVPGWYGMTQVKWLARIDAIAASFDGYQQAVAYRYRSGPDDPGTPVTRMRPRALIIPPGFPDFLTRRRTVERGDTVVHGRAWSGMAPVTRVEFGIDGAWQDAALLDPLGPFAWRAWSCEWRAAPGEHLLACRATDAAGNIQPVEQPWNLQGMGNNLIQQVPVSVR